MSRLLIAFALLTPLSVNAASFDCQKAQAADEKTICAHLALNDKDVEMHAKYQFLKGLFAMVVRDGPSRRAAGRPAELAETTSAVQGRRHLPDKSL